MKALLDFFTSALVLLVLAVLAEAAYAAPPKTCLDCHSKKISGPAFSSSVHGELACIACHRTAASPHDKTSQFEKIDCSRCHSQIATEHEGSVHNAKRLEIGCTKCHFDIHTMRSKKKDKFAINKMCIQCHSRELSYFESAHGKGVEEGHADSATCADCHGLHAIAKIDNRSSAGRAFHTQACLKCHADEAMMTRNKVLPIAPATFFESYHGKNVRLGYSEKVAGCADCHSAHAILKASNPNSTIHPNHLVKTCSQCHANATPLFTQYYPHADHRDAEKYPVLFWTFVGMTGLLIGTFLIFWLHSLLWAVRSFIEEKQKAKLAAFPDEKKSGRPVAHDIKDGKTVYRRFKPIHIFMHLLVIVSFLGLSLTGLPLRFSSTSWGKAVVDFIGGTTRAGLIHRACAVITFIYFGMAVVMSVRFLFFDKRVKGTFLQKLLGPDSLWFNRRDLKDIKAMFRWFLFRGPKPTFERWTYWEKFDFLAVFWGMFAIGSSGLMLWFPEFFGRFLPGWVFNVATIIHSDEALLATGFIFTVHFFNTHLRAEKFPMDFVIFNGELSKEEMIEERGDQWKRYEKAGTTEEYRVTKPSPILWDLALRAFGFLAVFIGLSLAIAIVYAMIWQR